MATWKIQVTHALAPLEPTLSVGSAGTDVPKGNVRTLDPNLEFSADAGVGGPVQLRFDRGATMTNYPVNCVTALNHNFDNFVSTGANFIVYSGASAGSTTNTRYTAQPSTRDPLFSTFSDDTNRHFRVDIGTAAGVNYKVGLVSVGQYFDLGNPLFGEVWSATSPGGPEVSGTGANYITGTFHGGRTINAKFRRVTRTNAQALMFLYHQKYIMKATSATAHIIAAVGGGGGANPIILVDDNGEVYYGPAQITATSWNGQYVEIDVRLTEIPYRKTYF